MTERCPVGPAVDLTRSPGAVGAKGLASGSDQAQNQALRFANALRWERGQRKEAEEKLEAMQHELAQSRKLGKKLTSELQATSSLLSNAARAAELLQKQKRLTKKAEESLRQQSAELNELRARCAGDSSSSNTNTGSAQLQNLGDDATLRQLRAQLADRDEELRQLRHQMGQTVQVRSPFKADPHALFAGRGGGGEASFSGGAGERSRVSKSLWPSPSKKPPRAPLGAIAANHAAAAPLPPHASRARGVSAPAAMMGFGVACTCGDAACDDAGNYQCRGCPEGLASTAAAATTHDDVDGCIDLADGMATSGVMDCHEQPIEDSVCDIDLARMEQNGADMDARAAQSGFGDDPVPGGHAPYFCTSLDCELAVVKRLGWHSTGPGAESADGADSDEVPGCGRALEGALRFDSARFGAALDIVFTGSVEHLVDQEWQSDLLVDECPCCDASFGLITRRHHCRVCGEIFCGDCVIRKCPYFVPDEDDDEAAEAQGDGNGPASPGAEFRNTLALAVVDTNTDTPLVTGKVLNAPILCCHTCFAMLQLLGASQHGPQKSGIRFNMLHAGS